VSDDVTTRILGELAQIGINAQKIERVEKLLTKIIDLIGDPDAADADEFRDIDANRTYTVSELSTLKGRECSTTSIYKAIALGQLRETKSAGVKGIEGREYIRFLRDRPTRRRRPAKAKA